ncbi:MAG: HD domain-containing protein, partial [Planctomycetota bacterium]
MKDEQVMKDQAMRDVIDESANAASALAASALVTRAAEFAQATLQGDSSGHDWWHVWRVWQSALRIGKCEGADLEVVQLAALLHDIADWKFHDGDETAGPRVARNWLAENGASAEVCDQVAAIIESLSFKGAGVDTSMATVEGRVVQDADRLDAIGAIGVA